MNIKQLIYFCKVVEMGGVSHAARTLNVVSNAISMQLAALEGELGAELFDRRTRPMALTTFGQFFYPRAREIAGKFGDLEKDAAFFLKDHQSICNVGFTRSMMLSVMPETIKRFSRQFSHARVNLMEALSEYQPELLLEKKIDLGITRELTRDPLHFSGLNAELVMVDPLVAVIQRDHPLAAQDSVKLEELLVSPLILYPKDHRSTYAEALVQSLYRHACCPTIIQQAIELNTALGLVSAGVGVSIVGRSVHNNARHDLLFKPIVGFDCSSYVYAITRQGCANEVVGSFKDTLKSVTSQQSGDAAD